MKDKLTRADIKTGMFGVTIHEHKFVVVGDKLIYASGGFDYIRHCNPHVCLNPNNIKFLANAGSFDGLEVVYASRKYGSTAIIYDADATKPVEMTMSEIEEKLGIKNLKIIKEEN